MRADVGSSTLFCAPQRGRPGIYSSFYPSPFCVRMCGDEDVFEAVVSEGSHDDPAGYWGWWDIGDEKWSMVWPSRVQSDMCFPYGPRAEEQAGRGWQLPARVEIVRQLTPEEVRNS